MSSKKCPNTHRTDTTYTQSALQQALFQNTSMATLSSSLPSHRQSTSQSSLSSIATFLLSGSPISILVALVVAISLPVLLHLYHISQIKSSKGTGSDGIPLFLLCGPQGSGKTALVTLLQRRTVESGAVKIEKDDATGEVRGRLADGSDDKNTVNGNGHAIAHSPTRLSQASTTVGLALPPGTPLGSNKYRSENDHETVRSMRESTPYKIRDTPGHGKLRSDMALNLLSRPNTGLRGVLFMVDSAALETEAVLKDTVAYLHDVLLGLQRRRKVLKNAGEMRVLIAANKQDLFTALPANAAKARLQTELDLVRISRRKGVSKVDKDENEEGDEDVEVLGGGGEDKFGFKALEDEFEICVDVLPGSVREGQKGIGKWEEWIGSCL